MSTATKVKTPKTKDFNVSLDIELTDVDSGRNVSLKSINPETNNDYLNDIVVWLNNNTNTKCLKTFKKNNSMGWYVSFGMYKNQLTARYKYIIDGSCGPSSSEYAGLHFFDYNRVPITLSDQSYLLTIRTSELKKKTRAQSAQQRVQKKQKADAAKAAAKAQKKQATEALRKAKKQAAEALRKAKKQAKQAAAAAKKKTA